MRPICCRFWQFNCWTFKVSFVVCTSSFVGSAWASSLVLDLRLWRASSLSCMLGSGLSRSPPLVLGSMFFICGLSFYLDVVDSHLLLSLAGLVRCDTKPTLVKHSCETQARAAVLPPSSGAAWQAVHLGVKKKLMACLT